MCCSAGGSGASHVGMNVPGRGPWFIAKLLPRAIDTSYEPVTLHPAQRRTVSAAKKLQAVSVTMASKNRNLWHGGIEATLPAWRVGLIDRVS